MKLLLFIVILLLLFVAGFLLFRFLYTLEKPISQSQNRDIEMRRINNSHASIYFAEFQYSKNTKTFKFIGSGTTRGDIPIYDQTKPEVLNDTLAIRVRQVDKTNLLISQGWQLLFLKALQPLNAPEGTYTFKIFVKNLPGSLIYLYNQEGKQVWLGSIN